MDADGLWSRMPHPRGAGDSATEADPEHAFGLDGCGNLGKPESALPKPCLNTPAIANGLRQET